MRTPVAGVLAVVLAGVGCGGDGEERAFSCSRGFRAADWRGDQLKTAQSVEKCGWLDGWREGDVLRALGRPTNRNGRYLTWDLGMSKRGLGPTGWFLIVEQSGRHGPVKRATTEVHNV